MLRFLKKMGDHCRKYYVVLEKGKKLNCFLPGVPQIEDYYVPSSTPSWGENGGAYIFNWDGEYAIITCSSKIANRLLAKFGNKLKGGAFVHYHSKGKFCCDTEDGAIAKMVAACGK